MPAFAMRLRNEQGAQCADNEFGEIELAGGSLAPFYFDDHLPLGGQDGFHATGHVGFVNDAELFVTGRISDRIKVNGQSFFAADFEQAVDRLPCVRQLGLGMVCRLQQCDPASPVQNQPTRLSGGGHPNA